MLRPLSCIALLASTALGGCAALHDQPLATREHSALYVADAQEEAMSCYQLFACPLISSERLSSK